MSENLMTPEFRVSFPWLFKPQKPMEGSTQEAKYSVVMLFPKNADLSALKKAAQDAITEKWGDKPPKGLRSPFRDGDEKDTDGYAGCVFITATSKNKPGVVDAKVQDVIDSEVVYAGCYARATVRAYAYDANGNRGVGFGLQNLQKLRDGEPLSGRKQARDEFGPVDVPQDDPFK